MKKIRTILVDDHRPVRNSLRELLSDEDGIEIVGEAEDGEEAVRLALELRPDVVVMDVGLPKLGGADSPREIRTSAPEVRVLALSLQADSWTVAAMRAAGAAGYVLKDHAASELVCGIRAVARGKSFFSAGVAVDAAPGQPRVTVEGSTARRRLRRGRVGR